MNILDKIVESKKAEIERLYKLHDFQDLSDGMTQSHPITSGTPRFYGALAEARAAGKPFFISEFKRKSPSEGWINRDADLPAQVRAYVQAGAGVISVLTDEPFFGGSYEDLDLAAQTLHHLRPAVYRPPLLLQKDFILDPIQIYLAKGRGADIILLIAAILEPDRLDFLKKTAESLGMGVLVEVHDAAELEKVRHLDFPVLGINNRDLKTFRTALNRVNVLTVDGGRSTVDGGGLTEDGGRLTVDGRRLTVDGGRRFIISESGVRDFRDFQAIRNADGFLIGTGLMRNSAGFQGDQSRQETAGDGKAEPAFSEVFKSQGKFLFKACGIRTPEMIALLGEGAAQNPSHTLKPDFIGINFSPVSKRRIEDATFRVLKAGKIPSGAVAVFYKNSESEIREILEQYPFRAVQLYAGDVRPEFVRSLKQRVLMAVRIDDQLSWEEAFARLIEPYAADVDFFILDGAAPGSGQRIRMAIPNDFPYPFLLAGGLHKGNLEAVTGYQNCIGADIASGIEEEGNVSMERIQKTAARLAELSAHCGSGRFAGVSGAFSV